MVVFKADPPGRIDIRPKLSSPQEGKLDKFETRISQKISPKIVRLIFVPQEMMCVFSFFAPNLNIRKDSQYEKKIIKMKRLLIIICMIIVIMIFIHSFLKQTDEQFKSSNSQQKSLIDYFFKVLYYNKIFEHQEIFDESPKNLYHNLK